MPPFLCDITTGPCQISLELVSQVRETAGGVPFARAIGPRPASGDPTSWRRLRVALRSTMAFVWRKHVREVVQYPWKLVLLADPRAAPAQREAVVEEFTTTNACCLPSGFSRTLRLAGADLTAHNTHRLLYWFAHMVRLTTADVEVRHARNSVSAGKTGNMDFSNVVSQYVIAEYSELRRASVLSEVKRAQHELAVSGSSTGAAIAEDHDGHAIGLPLAKRQRQRAAGGAENKRGKTAMQCFFADVDLSHLKESGRMTKRFWERAREAFAALPSERQEAYHAQSHISHLQAKSQRACILASSSNAESSTPRVASRPMPSASLCTDVDGFGCHAPSGGLVSANTISPSRLPSPAALPSSTVESASCYAKLVGDAHQCATRLQQAYMERDEEAILAELVEEGDLKNFIARQPIKKSAAEFQQSTRNIGKCDGSSGFPSRVEYPRHCRSFCANDGEAAGAAIVIMAMLKDAAQRCLSPSKVPGADMLLGVEASFSGHTSRTFWWMLAASFQSGHHVATQTFWKCSPKLGVSDTSDDYRGLLLKVDRGDVVTPLAAPSPPFDQQCAAPRFFGEEVVAREILCSCGGDRDDALLHVASEVVIKKLLFSETDGADVSIHGVCDTFEVLKLSEYNGRTSRRRAPAAARPRTPSAGPDFLHLLDQERRLEQQLSASSRGPKRTPRGAASGVSSPAQSDALDRLAEELGLAVGAIHEDAMADLAILDGLAEALGLDVISELSRVRFELEEADAEADLATAASLAGDGDVVAEQAQASPHNIVGAGALAPAPPTEAAEVGEIHFGLRIVRTGFEQGCIANCFIPQPAAISGSSPHGLKAGILHRINAQGLKMTCTLHMNCVCWLTFRHHTFEQSWHDLVQWLSLACPAGENLDEKRHFQEAIVLKRAYGMRVK